MGTRLAKQYLNANEEAISNIYNIIKEEQIDCDFEWKDSYIFTRNEKELEKIKMEVEVVNILGKKAEFTQSVYIPIDGCLGAIKFKNQAQFNPCKYGLGLAKKIKSYGGEIYEKSKVYGINKINNYYEVKSEEGSVICKYVIIASHYPIINFPGMLFLKMYQETSYLIAVETKEELFDGIFISSEEPVISLRTIKEGDKKLLVIGGMKHKTGKKRN